MEKRSDSPQDLTNPSPKKRAREAAKRASEMTLGATTTNAIFLGTNVRIKKESGSEIHPTPFPVVMPDMTTKDKKTFTPPSEILVAIIHRRERVNPNEIDPKTPYAIRVPVRYTHDPKRASELRPLLGERPDLQAKLDPVTLRAVHQEYVTLGNAVYRVSVKMKSALAPLVQPGKDDPPTASEASTKSMHSYMTPEAICSKIRLNNLAMNHKLAIGKDGDLRVYSELSASGIAFDTDAGTIIDRLALLPDLPPPSLEEMHEIVDAEKEDPFFKLTIEPQEGRLEGESWSVVHTPDSPTYEQMSTQDGDPVLAGKYSIGFENGVSVMANLTSRGMKPHMLYGLPAGKDTAAVLNLIAPFLHAVVCGPISSYHFRKDPSALGVWTTVIPDFAASVKAYPEAWRLVSPEGVSDLLEGAAGTGSDYRSMNLLKKEPVALLADNTRCPCLKEENKEALLQDWDVYAILFDNKGDVVKGKKAVSNVNRGKYVNKFVVALPKNPMEVEPPSFDYESIWAEARKEALEGTRREILLQKGPRPSQRTLSLFERIREDWGTDLDEDLKAVEDGWKAAFEQDQVEVDGAPPERQMELLECWSGSPYDLVIPE